ncbi:NAD(P)/FAD-dependent oxidoreductase [Feifania hominis]|uniref:NAD(P)/FAD-dependent oxidoreductase n=1 Tax=Feifania hominis TaxID=2763660 RepID=A0A926DAM6_9FIRM|nr:NAD(P)/FAD-dependent oxidoreductase [Feifania hominis]MBC8535495.1 NAD(P)/FAD-dependent oxidoreductase [Feifania hominis]
MYDAVIIGCGVIGAATAYELSHYRFQTLVLERDNDVANATTKANSGIIHAGYDPAPGTLMARYNVRGAELAGEICEKLDVPYRRVGSLVIALSPKELQVIEQLYERGIANGVPELRLLDAGQVKEMEPQLSERVLGALYAPTAAVVSPWEYALAMAQTAVANGVELRLRSEVLGMEKTDGGWRIETAGGTVETRYVFNAAGVQADRIHNMAAPPTFSILPNRGEYYLLDKSEGERVGRVIFQCPDKDGKGVLVAPTAHGNLIVGPNSERVANEDVANTAAGLERVADRARRSVPSVNLRESIRNFAGVRAVADRDDFIIEQAAPGFYDLAGIKSPGLSAAPAIAERATQFLREAGETLEPKPDFCDRRRRTRISELPTEEKNRLIAQNPLYGRVICRCETVTEGEIVDALHAPIPPCSVDGVKRRVNTGMGRCQGGFCGPRVLEILTRELGLEPTEVLQDRDHSEILVGETKGGGAK